MAKSGQSWVHLSHRMGAHGVDGSGVIICGNDVVRAAVKYGVRGVEPWDRPGSGIANADIPKRDGPVFLDRAGHKRSGERGSDHQRLNRHCMLQECLKGQARAHTHGNACFTSCVRMKEQDMSLQGNPSSCRLQPMQQGEGRHACTCSAPLIQRRCVKTTLTSWKQVG